MYKSLIILVSLFALFSCSGGEQNDNGQISTDLINNPVTASGNEVDTSLLPQFKFEDEFHDFGIIIQGEKVSYTFKFKNIGKSDLILSSVHASCGCTVPKYDSKPIKPGEDGFIEVVFDSSGRSGMQQKTVTVMANTQPSVHELKFVAEVVVPNNN